MVEGRAQPRTVLVVDDDASLRLLCRVNLDLDGHRVVEAATVAAALAALDEHEVDVILLDLHLGSASGLDVLDAVEAADLPARVVLLSGSSDLPADVRGRVAASLGKPFTLEDLARVVADDASGRLRGA
ncbi:MAG TPA: response regulator [Gaiellaceae bacterium]|jgi:DNA-binding NtrC family response regulator|nr:response regulator [Gaiellaceae bacterium]